MKAALYRAIDLAEDALRMSTSEAVGDRLLGALRPWGATSLWARQFYLTPRWMDSAVSAHYETFDYARIRRTDWWGSAAQKFADVNCPISPGSARFARPFFTSEVTQGAERHYAPYWEAMAEFGVADTLAVPYFGPHTAAAGITIWFDHRVFDPEAACTLRMAGALTLERMRQLKAPLTPQRPKLSPRERDCLAFVAEGKSDWDISAILGIAHATARAHVENARFKLDAQTRAQAVARAMTRGLI